MSSPISIQFSLLVCSFFFPNISSNAWWCLVRSPRRLSSGTDLVHPGEAGPGKSKNGGVYTSLCLKQIYWYVYIYIVCFCVFCWFCLQIYIYICAYYVKSMLSIYLFVKLWMIIMMFGRSTECRLRWDTRVLRNSQKARLKYRLSPELLKQWDLTDQTRSDWSNPIFSQTLDVDVSQDKGQMFLVRGGALFVVRGTQGIPHSWARWTVAAMIHDGDEPMDEKGIW